VSADAAFHYEIRAAGQTDLPFIFSTWLKSFRKSPFARSIPATTYFKHQHDKVAQKLNDSQTLIAHPVDDPDTILGWVCGGGALIHWVYVKRTWRGIGIGRRLVAELAEVGKSGEYTHLPAEPIPSWLKNWTYNPYR
jgi:GNAT superfamily N-acetyltransferase